MSVYVVEAYRNGHLCGRLGRKKDFGFTRLTVFALSADGYCTWKTEAGAKRAIEKKKEYTVNHYYCAKDSLEAAGYQLKIVKQ